MNFMTIISVPEYQQLVRFNQDNCVTFDVRYELSDPYWGVSQYQEAHIEHAYFLHQDNDLSGKATGKNGRHPLPDMEALSEKLGRAGVTKGKQVIVYDQDNGMMAARLWWLLRYMGHKNVAVLDGGFKAWLRSDLPVTTVKPSATESVLFHPQLQQEKLILVNEVLDHLHHPEIQIVDARSRERFDGIVMINDTVLGHIPGAINRPYTDNINSQGRFKSTTQLTQELTTLVSTDKTIIHSCGSGISACHNYLAFELTGKYPKQRLYAGSWSEYASDSTRPIEKTVVAVEDVQK